MHKNRFLSIFGDSVKFLSNLLTAVFSYLIPSSDDRANNFARGVYISWSVFFDLHTMHAPED